MQQQIPSQCPECRGITVEVTSLPPSQHDKGTDWQTRAECTKCDGYVQWFD